MCAVLCLAAQSRPTLCDPMNSGLPGSPVHGVLQAGRLEWVAMPSSRGSSRPGDCAEVSCIAGGFFTVWDTREAHACTWVSEWSCSVVSDSLRPHGLQPTRLLGPWDYPGKNTGVGCHFLLQMYLGGTKETDEPGKPLIYKVIVLRGGE